MAGVIAEHRERLVEVLAECDDELTDKFLNGDELTVEELGSALRKGTLEGLCVPVLCGSAYTNAGVGRLLDFMVEVSPIRCTLRPRPLPPEPTSTARRRPWCSRPWPTHSAR